MSQYAALGLALLSLTGAGGLAFVLGRLPNALKQPLIAPVPSVSKSVKEEIETMFALSGLAVWTPGDEDTSWREEPPMTPEEQASSDSSVQVSIAELKGELRNQAREVTSVRTSVEREIGKLASALEKHADIVTRSLDSIKAEFVTRSENAAKNEAMDARVKRMETLFNLLSGLVAAGIVGAIAKVIFR